MKHLLIATTAILSAAAIGQALAQASSPGPQQAQLAPQAHYSFNAPTPQDAYRDGLINRWELQQLVGPLPQALQGPPVDGNRGDSDGGRN